MSLGYQGDNFLFQIVASLNKKLPNSVRIVVNDHFFYVNSDKTLKFAISDGPESKKTTLWIEQHFYYLNQLAVKRVT